MNKYYFSFGSGHHDTHGRTLDGYYTVIEAASEPDARAIFVRRFGSKWAGTYDESKIGELREKYGWEELWFGDLDICSQLPQEDAVKLFGLDSFRNRYPQNQAEAVAIIERLQLEFDL